MGRPAQRRGGNRLGSGGSGYGDDDAPAGKDRLKAWPRRLLVVVGVLALVVVAGFAFADQLAHAAAAAGGRAAGYSVEYERLRVAAGHVTIEHPVITSLAGEPIFTAQSIEVAYAPGAVFGGPYWYGISAVELDRPRFTLIHHKDGSYNITLPSPNPNATQAPLTVPVLHLVLKNGSFGLLDDTRIFAHSRRIAVEDIALDANVVPSGRSTFTLRLAVLEQGGEYPFVGRGTFDEVRGYEMVRIRAKALALGPLFDYAINSATLHLSNGTLNDIDARVYGLPDAGGRMQRHLSVTANLDHFQPYLNGITKPLRDGRGQVRVYDQGLTIPRVDGSIAGVPVRIAGAIYDLAKPTVRLGIVGRGDVHNLITLSDSAKKFPLGGPVDFRLFVEGDATQPTTLATFGSPHLTYESIGFDDPSGLVVLRGQETDIVRAALRYDDIAIGARGRVSLGKHTGLDMLANVVAPAARVPYGAQVLGPMLVRGTAVVTGTDANLLTTAVIAGRTASQRLAGTLEVDGRGVGTIGPFVLDGPGDASLFARVALDRPRAGGGAAFLSAREFHLSVHGPQPSLPGLPRPPEVRADGTLDADVAGALAGTRYAFGGAAHLYGAHALGFPVDDLTARGSVSDGTNLAVAARYRGALAPLAAAAGGRLAASGRVDIPVTLVASGPSVLYAQIAGARFDHARVAGVTLDALDATVGIRPSAIDVYAARARIDGDDIVARGSFGNGGTLAVSAGNIGLSALRTAGVPVNSGRITALATVGGTVAAPRVTGDVIASDVRLANPQAAAFPVDVTTGVTLRGGTLALRDSLAQAGPAVASLDGAVHGVRGDPRAVRYTFDARIRQADLGILARLTKAPLRYPAGSLDADLHVAGQGDRPRFAGTLSIPEGSVNGLFFRNGSLNVGGTLAELRASGGHVTVGNSVIGFSATISRGAQRFALHAPHVQLADLNDYFDEGDTLGGNGSIDAAVANGGDRIVTTGRVRLAHTRFRRFDLGDARADWSTHGRTLGTSLALGTTSGSVSASGTVVLPASQPLRNTFARSTLAIDTRAESVDLGTWLPAAGIVTPLSGSVDADARITGTYPSVSLRSHAALIGGMLGPVALHTATLDLRAASGRGTISSAVLAIDNASARASGTFGFRPSDPLDLHVVAQTADAGALAKTLTGKTYDAAGQVTTTLGIGGTPRHPQLSGTLDATSLRYERLTLPHAHAEATVTETRATLRNAEVDLDAGRLLASGAVPVHRAPAFEVPADAPLSLAFTADHAQLGQFAALLPKGTSASGELDGTVTVVGTRAAPGLRGNLTLSNGSFVGPELRSRVTNGVAELVFSGRNVSLENTSASVGGGTISASGQLMVPDLQDPARTASANLTLVSRYAVLDAPAFLKGRINGTVTIARASGAGATVRGSVAFTSTRIPPTVIVPKGGPTPAASALPIPVAFDVGVDVGNDVRVQGGPVDIGAKGHLQLGGTLAAPTLEGRLESTGGTLSFYRTFQLQYPSSVAFEPSNGVIPYVDANATTTVDNPPTDVTLHVTGPATGLTVVLGSDPSYSQEQILGLLAGLQTFGAVSGVQTVAGVAQPNPFQAAAAGELGTLLTQNLLEPFSSQLGSAVGLSNLAINYSPYGGVSLGAQKKLLKNVNAVFAESFNYPPRQSIGVRANPSAGSAIQLTFFSQPSSNRFNAFEGAYAVQSSNASVSDSEPANGASGFSLSFQRRFP